MADQENAGAGAPEESAGSNKGKTPDGQAAGTKSDKVEVMEEAQKDAAKEREEDRGYQ